MSGAGPASRSTTSRRAIPAWTAFIEHPDQPPKGVESLAQVQTRAVAVVERILAHPELGNFIAVVAHADIVKVILAHYMRIHLDTTLRHMYIGNASISALAFHEDEKTPTMLAVNWSPAPEWLAPHPKEPAPGEPHRRRGDGGKRYERWKLLAILSALLLSWRLCRMLAIRTTDGIYRDRPRIFYAWLLLAAVYSSSNVAPA